VDVDHDQCLPLHLGMWLLLYVPRQYGNYADTLDMKHKYGYMEIPGAGIFSVPPDLFSSRDRNFVKVFNEAVTCEVSSSFNC
jgi:hypothetical protein